jgi:hypothetical protein
MRHFCSLAVDLKVGVAVMLVKAVEVQMPPMTPSFFAPVT